MKKIVFLTLFLLCVFAAAAQDFAKLYNELSPSVVTILVKEQHAIADQQSMTKRMVTSEGLGSGVLVNENGDIWTAAHVIQTAKEVLVRFQSGEEIPARVITSNAAVDVALIRLVWKPTKAYAIAKVGVSKDVQIGDKVFVVGAPFGLERSLSVGYISGRLRNKRDAMNFSATEYFQTDAAINHGNSGGPMFNLNGEVIGLVSSILSQSGGFDGIGFVATSDIAALHLTGDQPFWFGAQFRIVRGDLCSIFNLPQEMGLLVQKVAFGSPASLMGLKEGIFKTEIEGMELLTGGDIITHVGNIIISPRMNIDEIEGYMANLKPGEQFKITIWRNGKSEVLTGIVPRR